MKPLLALDQLDLDVSECLVQLRLYNTNGLFLSTDQSLEISVTPKNTEQPLSGTTSVFYDSVDRIARFTDLAFLKPADNVKLFFQCESCKDAGGSKILITVESESFNIGAALHRIAYVYPRPGIQPYIHPNVAGEVMRGFFVVETTILCPLCLLTMLLHSDLCCLAVHISLSSRKFVFQLLATG